MWSKPVFDSDRKNILRNDYDNESKRLRRHLQICFLCRNFFRVWPTAIDERIAADPRNLALNPNLNASGGGDRRSANRIPNALHFKKPRPNLDLTETENDDPAERSFEIAPEDNEIGLEDPFDFNDGLRDAEADDIDNNSDGDISDGDIFDENNLDGNFSMMITKTLTMGEQVCLMMIITKMLTIQNRMKQKVLQHRSTLKAAL